MWSLWFNSLWHHTRTQPLLQPSWMSAGSPRLPSWTTFRQRSQLACQPVGCHRWPSARSCPTASGSGTPAWIVGSSGGTRGFRERGLMIEDFVKNTLKNLTKKSIFFRKSLNDPHICSKIFHLVQMLIWLAEYTTLDKGGHVCNLIHLWIYLCGYMDAHVNKSNLTGTICSCSQSYYCF